MHNSIIVSVCVITFNHEKYISTCLDSILRQETSYPFEIILGEDGSSDKTREICLTYANNYPDKIKLFLRDRKDVIYINGEPTGKFNFIETIKASRGKYIAICEGDDFWTDNYKLEKQINFLEANSDFNICFHPIKILNQNTGELLEDNITRVVPEITNKIDLLKGNYIHTPTVIFRNNFNLPDWFKEVIPGDWPLYLLACDEKKIKNIPDKMAVYRIHNKGNWSSIKIEQREKQLYHMYKVVSRTISFTKEERIFLDKLIEKYRKVLQNRKRSKNLFYKVFYRYFK